MNHLPLLRVALAATLSVPAFAYAQALPYLPTGDARLRHEVQMEVDDGTMPLGLTWPIPTRDIPEDKRDGLRSEWKPGSGQDAGWFVNGGAHPTPRRTFDDTPRENGEIGVQSGWAAGDYAGGAFRLAVDFSPQDGKKLRADDTYAAWRYGNWWASIGLQQRWWGPGHDGSLILGNNARPMFGVALERAEARRPDWKWMRWVGPYRWTTFMSKLEHDQSGYPHPLVWGLRLDLRPLKSVEIGFSRTAQWCRPHVCGFSALKDVVLGHDNQGENVSANKEPGNQEAGYDVRWKVPFVPLAAYYQLNGESIDNRNWRPRQTTNLLGLETWGGARDVVSWRAFAEWTETTCGGLGGGGTFGCAYENGLFAAGYRYRGRVLGHSIERDARLATLGALLVDSRGRTWEARLRHADLNRGNRPPVAGSLVAPIDTKLWNAEVQLTGRWSDYRYVIGVGADRLEPVGGSTRTVGRAFAGVSASW